MRVTREHQMSVPSTLRTYQMSALLVEVQKSPALRRVILSSSKVCLPTLPHLATGLTHLPYLRVHPKFFRMCTAESRAHSYSFTSASSACSSEISASITLRLRMVLFSH